MKTSTNVPTVATVAAEAIAIIDREIRLNNGSSRDRCNTAIAADAIASIDLALRAGLYQGFRGILRLPVLGKCGHYDLHAGEYSLRIAIRSGRMTFATLSTNEGWSYNVQTQDLMGLKYVLEKLAKAG